MSKIIIIQSIPWSSYGQLDNLSKKVYFKEIRPAVYSQSVDNHAIFRAKRSTRINVGQTFTQYFWVLIDSSRPIPFKQRGMSHNACICNHGHQKLDSNRLTCEQITRFLCFSLREMSTSAICFTFGSTTDLTPMFVTRPLTTTTCASWHFSERET